MQLLNIGISQYTGPDGYPGGRPVNYDHMDNGQPPYEEDSRQGYGEDGPRSYMDDGKMPSAPPDYYAEDPSGDRRMYYKAFGSL